MREREREKRKNVEIFSRNFYFISETYKIGVIQSSSSSSSSIPFKILAQKEREHRQSMNRVCRVLILLTLPHIATSTLKRTEITDKGSWSVNNEADVENGRVVLKSYDFVETASPLMVEHNFECEMTVERGEGGAISMWIVKDMIKDLDESTFEKDFDGICVRLDTDQESVEIKSGSRFQMQPVNES